MAEESDYDCSEEDTIDETPTGCRRNEYGSIVLANEEEMESVDLDLPVNELVQAPTPSVRLRDAEVGP